MDTIDNTATFSRIVCGRSNVSSSAMQLYLLLILSSLLAVYKYWIIWWVMAFTYNFHITFGGLKFNPDY